MLRKVQKRSALFGISAISVVVCYSTTRTLSSMWELYVLKDSRQACPDSPERGFRNRQIAMRFTLAIAVTLKETFRMTRMYVYFDNTNIDLLIPFLSTIVSFALFFSQ